MPSSASLTRDPLAVVVSIERAMQVTEPDLGLAGDLMRSVVLEKTAGSREPIATVRLKQSSRRFLAIHR